MHLASWDAETGERIRRHPGHEEVINCMDVSKRGEEMLVSGSDDGYIGASDLHGLKGVWLTLRPDLGHTNQRRRNFHFHRLSGYSNMSSRGWK